MQAERAHKESAEAAAGSEESPREGAAQLGRRIAQMRRRRHWSQSELGRRLGVPRERISHWECGLHEPSVKALVGLRRELGVSLDELVTGEPAPPAALDREKQEKALSHIAGLVRLLSLSKSVKRTAAGEKP
jgi:transcriptional regulator with XRE-family HTH domain